MTLKDFQRMDHYEAMARVGGKPFVDTASAKRAKLGPIGPETQRRISAARAMVK